MQLKRGRLGPGWGRLSPYIFCDRFLGILRKTIEDAILRFCEINKYRERVRVPTVICLSLFSCRGVRYYHAACYVPFAIKNRTSAD